MLSRFLFLLGEATSSASRLKDGECKWLPLAGTQCISHPALTLHVITIKHHNLLHSFNFFRYGAKRLQRRRLIKMKKELQANRRSKKAPKFLECQRPSRGRGEERRGKGKKRRGTERGPSSSDDKVSVWQPIWPFCLLLLQTSNNNCQPS